MFSNLQKTVLQGAVSGTTRILDAALAAGVKQVIITASIVSLVATTDFWKEITISEKCKPSQLINDQKMGNGSS